MYKYMGFAVFLMSNVRFRWKADVHRFWNQCLFGAFSSATDNFPTGFFLSFYECLVYWKVKPDIQ